MTSLLESPCLLVSLFEHCTQLNMLYLLQLVKVHDGRQEFYPIPPKVVAPNLQDRSPEMRVSQRSANALRNLERDQWQTTYDRSNSGIGPINPNKLDNLQEKTTFYDTYGITDDKLVSY